MRLPFAVLGYARDRADVQALCDAATMLGEWQLRRGYAPPIWDSPARYKREEHRTLPGVERVQLPEETHAMGGGDCDDLAPWAAASLRLEGIDARPLVIHSPGVGYHVLTIYRHPTTGRMMYYDPSAERGMYEVGGRSDRRRIRAQKRRAALARARQIVEQVERMNPYSAAARALGQEAMRLLAVASDGSTDSQDSEDGGS